MPAAPSKIPSSLRPQLQPGAAKGPLPQPPTPNYFKGRSFVRAAGIAVIVISGTLIGATYKSSHQAEEKKVIKKRVQADVGEQIAVLEEAKLNLLQRKGQLEQKIAEVREREARELELRIEKDRLRVQGDELKRQMELGRRG